MRRHVAILQTMLLGLGMFFVPHASAAAAPDCRAVADAMKEMERNIVLGWEEKNAGGQEVQALQSARSIVDAFTSMPSGAQACLNGDGKMHLFVLVSKANVLIAALNQSSASIKNRNLPMAHDIVVAASRYRNANSIYWRAINEGRGEGTAPVR